MFYTASGSSPAGGRGGFWGLLALRVAPCDLCPAQHLWNTRVQMGWNHDYPAFPLINLGFCPPKIPFCIRPLYCRKDLGHAEFWRIRLHVPSGQIPNVFVEPLKQ
jgi:hypothetical protein